VERIAKPGDPGLTAAARATSQHQRSKTTPEARQTAPETSHCAACRDAARRADRTTLSTRKRAIPGDQAGVTLGRGAGWGGVLRSRSRPKHSRQDRAERVFARVANRGFNPRWNSIPPGREHGRKQGRALSNAINASDINGDGRTPAPPSCFALTRFAGLAGSLARSRMASEAAHSAEAAASAAKAGLAKEAVSCGMSICWKAIPL
jgi:hypothetical protein